MAQLQSTSAPRRSSALRAAAGLAGSVLVYAVLVSAGALALAWAVAAATGIGPSVPAVAALGALLGAMASPPIRLPLERRDAAGHGSLIVLAGMVISGALVTAMGLPVLAAATSAGCVAHAVQVRPTTRQLVQTCAMALACTVAAWAAEHTGLVQAVVNPTHTAVLMVGLWVLLIPGMLNAADTSRRATRAAQQLDAERRAHVAALQHAVSHDALTGLLSRRGLGGPLAEAAAVAGPGHLSAVLFVDLDGFKTVNDVHGHDAGDALLGELGLRLGAALPPAGQVTGQAARIGGDEFVVVLTGLADEAGAHEMAGRLQVALEAPVVLPDGAQVSVGASTGVACQQVAGGGAQLLARADEAMYAAKRARRVRRESVNSH